jgi:hypothetical protein
MLFIYHKVTKTQGLKNETLERFISIKQFIPTTRIDYCFLRLCAFVVVIYK